MASARQAAGWGPVSRAGPVCCHQQSRARESGPQPPSAGTLPPLASLTSANASRRPWGGQAVILGAGKWATQFQGTLGSLSALPYI